MIGHSMENSTCLKCHHLKSNKYHANVSTDLQPIRNIELDRNRVRESKNNYKIGDDDKMHRDDQMHQSN